ncbi:MAG: glutathione S-transferase [Roseinatronobacter sp.]
MTPILWSFRRCPYAMRARLAIVQAGVTVTLREIVLRDKPAAFLAASPSATVPCLEHAGGVIDESLDIMHWALAQRDTAGWLDIPSDGAAWIARCDGPFKHALDRVKYAARYRDADRAAHLATACAFLADLDAQMGAAGPGDRCFARETLVDAALMPFVRQFAQIDRDWFDAQPLPHLQGWLAHWLASERFARIMGKIPAWQPGQPGAVFP